MPLPRVGVKLGKEVARKRGHGRDLRKIGGGTQCQSRKWTLEKAHVQPRFVSNPEAGKKAKEEVTTARRPDRSDGLLDGSAPNGANPQLSIAGGFELTRQRVKFQLLVPVPVKTAGRRVPAG